MAELNYYLKGDAITNISFIVETDTLLGDVAPNSFNVLRMSHKDKEAATEYKSMEVREFVTSNHIFNSSAFITGRLLLNAVKDNLGLRGIEIEIHKTERVLHTREYSVSIEVDKFIESVKELSNLLRTDAANDLIFNCTKMGVLFDIYGGSKFVNKIDALDFKEKIDNILGSKLDLDSLNNATYYTLSTVILRTLTLLFALSMIPIMSVRLENMLASISMSQPEDHDDGIHIFDKMLYGFEFFELVDHIMDTDSKDKNILNRNVMKAVKEPYSNKYTIKTTINPFRTDAVSYITSKREFHRANSLSFALFSYDKLKNHKSYETKGDTSIKKLLDPPVFIGKYRDRFSEFEDKESATLNIFFNACSLPAELCPDAIYSYAPQCKISNDKRHILAFEAAIRQFIYLDEIATMVNSRRDSKRTTKRFNVDVIGGMYEWALDVVLTSRLKALSVTKRRVHNLLTAITFYGVEGLLNEVFTKNMYITMVADFLEGTKLDKSRINIDVDNPSVLKFLQDCNSILGNTQEDMNIKLDIMTNVISSLSNNIRSTTVKAMILNNMKPLMHPIAKELGMDQVKYKNRHKRCSSILESSMKMTLVNNFNMRAGFTDFTTNYVLKIDKVSSLMESAIMHTLI
ncbi:MAG: hypothetical protein ACRC7S_15050 [Cetobacterium sp.]